MENVFRKRVLYYGKRFRKRFLYYGKCFPLEFFVL